MQNKIDGSISGKFVAVNNLSDIPLRPGAGSSFRLIAKRCEEN